VTNAARRIDAERRYPLADLMAVLAAELREARDRAVGDKLDDVVKVKECQVELGFSWERKGEGGIEFFVFKLGGGIGKADTQTLTVTLEPIGEIVAGLRSR
jgi:hypothetical protein